jgi:Flp pilus assembly protein TadG
MRGAISRVLATSRNSRLALSLTRRFARRKDGETIVEFAIVIVPFLALLFAIIEVALVFFAGQVLETAAADSARLIMTGQAQIQNLNEAAFKTKVCQRIYGLFDCANGIKVDVRTYNAFTSADMQKPVDGNGDVDTSGFTFQPGTPGDIVVVRVVYEWPTFVRTFGLNMADLANGNRLLMATAAFRNEPYTIPSN